MIGVVVIVNIALFLIWNYLTYKGIMENSRAARISVRSSYEAEILTSKGVGGFGLVYMLLFYILGMLAIFHNLSMNKILLKFFVAAIIASSVIIVFLSGFSIALLLLIASVLIYYFLLEKYIATITITIASVLIYYFFLDIGNIAASLDGMNYKIKLEHFMESIADLELQGTVYDRFERYYRSLTLFIENPIFGTLDRAIVGKHSLLLDTFAQFGFFIGSLFVYIIIKIPFDLHKRAKKNKNFSFSIIFLVIMTFSLNNIAMGYGYMIYIFFPYILYMLEKNKEQL